MAEGTKDLTAIGLEILQTARNELYLNLPLSGRGPQQPGLSAWRRVTLSLATDGETLYYDGGFLADPVSPVPGRRWDGRTCTCCSTACCGTCGRSGEKRRSCGTWPATRRWRASWTSWTTPALPGTSSPPGRNSGASAGERCRCLPQRGSTRHLLRRDLPPYEIARLQRVFLADDHGLWDPEGQDEEQQRQREQKWQGVSERTPDRAGDGALRPGHRRPGGAGADPGG